MSIDREYAASITVSSKPVSILHRFRNNAYYVPMNDLQQSFNSVKTVKMTDFSLRGVDFFLSALCVKFFVRYLPRPSYSHVFIFL